MYIFFVLIPIIFILLFVDWIWRFHTNSVNCFPGVNGSRFRNKHFRGLSLTVSHPGCGFFPSLEMLWIGKFAFLQNGSDIFTPGCEFIPGCDTFCLRRCCLLRQLQTFHIYGVKRFTGGGWLTCTGTFGEHGGRLTGTIIFGICRCFILIIYTL